MLKLIYLARRKPGFTFDEFVCRWRKHGTLGMSLPLWRFALGYVQAEPILPAPIPGTTEEFDAVACYMVRDDMFSAMGEDDVPGAIAMAEDELETFACPIPEVSLWVTEEHIRGGALGGITAFLFFDELATARETALRASRIASLHRITLNVRADTTPVAGMNSLPYAAVLELAAQSVSELAAAVAGDDTLLAAASVAVVTREAVLWNRLS